MCFRNSSITISDVPFSCSNKLAASPFRLPSVYVADGTHATYFAPGLADVSDTPWDGADKRLGTLIQYDLPSDVIETAGTTLLAINVWKYPDPDIETRAGRWGFKGTAVGAPHDFKDRNGPPSINFRFSTNASGKPVWVRSQPKVLFNAALRAEDGDLRIE
jgi:hypothetical protein